MRTRTLVALGHEWQRLLDRGVRDVAFPDSNLNDPRLSGTKLFRQGLKFNSIRNALGLTVSRGIEALIGPRFPVESASVISPWPTGRLRNVAIWGRPGPGSVVFALTYR